MISDIYYRKYWTQKSCLSVVRDTSCLYCSGYDDISLAVVHVVFMYTGAVSDKCLLLVSLLMSTVNKVAEFPISYLVVEIIMMQKLEVL